LYQSFLLSSSYCAIGGRQLQRRRKKYRRLDRRGQQINSLDLSAGNSGPWLSSDEKRFVADRIDPRASFSDL